MAITTFQKIYKITIGQFTRDSGLTPIVELTQHRFKADITATAKDGTVKSPIVTKVQIYNLSPELISLLSKSKNIYLEVKAGYLYEGGVLQTVEDLPMVYFGSVVTTITIRPDVDLITEFTCTPFNDTTASATVNRRFSAGTKVRDIFKIIADTMSVSLSHEWTKQDSLMIQTSKTVEGSSTSVMNDWCERYNLRAVTDKGVMKIIDKAVTKSSQFIHKIPAQRIKEYPTISMNVTKDIKQGTPIVPHVHAKTFLYPRVSLNDIVSIELINYTRPQLKGDYVTEFQDFIVDAYTHSLDSHSSSTWTTIIKGKGDQQK